MPTFLIKLALVAPLVFLSPLVWGQYARHSSLMHHTDEMPNIVRVTHLSIKTDDREVFLQAATRMGGLSQKEAGCVQYCVSEDVSTRGEFFVVAEWTSAAAWEAHRRQAYTVDYLRQLPAWLATPATTTGYSALGRTVTTLVPTGK